MENGRARANHPGRRDTAPAERARLRLELSAWREELRALLSDGNALGAVDWSVVAETRRCIAETMAAMRRL